MAYIAESLGLYEVAEYWRQVLKINNYQRDRFAARVIQRLRNTLVTKKVTVGRHWQSFTFFFLSRINVFRRFLATLSRKTRRILEKPLLLRSSRLFSMRILERSQSSTPAAIHMSSKVKFDQYRTTDLRLYMKMAALSRCIRMPMRHAPDRMP